MITPEIKEQILDRIDIVDIIGQRITLRKAGTSFKACCPFHTEKTPSFIVTPERRSYHCFGCGAHGNVIDFLIDYDRLSFVEAITYLARQAGMTLEMNDPTAGADYKPLYQILEQANTLYQRQLRERSPSNPAVIYLKSRGVTGQIAKLFALGFAPPRWDFLLTQIGQTEPEKNLLQQAGLMNERDQTYYDRFRNRIMFPIRDRRGRTLGFGGRLLAEGTPKYLNSPETAVFHKGTILYGLYEVYQQQRQLSQILVVEGYMDVIALAQFGFCSAVATLGTATTPEHIQLLQRTSPETIFCFDGDTAGRAAAWKALKTALPFMNGQHVIRFLWLPDGQDPDSLIRQQGREAFSQLLEQSVLLSDFLFTYLTTNTDLRSPEARARLSNQALALIATVPAGIYRELLHQQLQQLVGLNTLIPRIDNERAPRARRLTPQTTTSRLLPPLTLSRRALALLLARPQLAMLADQVETHWHQLQEPEIAWLRTLITFLSAHPDADFTLIYNHWQERAPEMIAGLQHLQAPELIAHIPDEGYGDEWLGALAHLNQLARRQARYQAMLARSQHSNSASVKPPA
jgi:DNA primase